jgi:hypothetical protein
MSIENGEGRMSRQKINRVSAIAPVVMSLVAFAIVLLAVSTGWGMVPGDEGTAAHIFQILIVLQMPLILAFLATANWRNWRWVASRIVLQAAAIILAFSPVAYFKL